MRRRIGVLVCVLALPAVLLAPAWRLAGLGAIEDDVLYYLPMRTLLGELLRAGTLPYYNEWTGLGRPLLADPQTAVFYPPSWLFAVLDPLSAYAAVLWMHYSLAAWGAYRLLRSWHLHTAAALFGGMVFAGCGFMLAHRAHFAMVHAAAWTPIVFWRIERYALAGGLRRLSLAGLVAAAQCYAGHVQVAAITLLGLAVYLALRCPRRGVGLVRLGLAWLLAGGLFAVQWIPTLAYTLECTRLHRGYLDFTENSYNPVSLIGWLLPFFLGQRRPNFFDQPWWGPSHQVEQFCYIGIVPLILALACGRAGLGHDRRLRAAGWLAIFGMLLALGLYGPVCPLLYWLPGASLFRVPARALLLVHLAIVMLAAAGFDGLLRRPTPWRARLRYVVQNLTARPVRSTLVIVAACLVPFLIALPLVPAQVRGPLKQALHPTNPAIWMPSIVIVASLAAAHLASRAKREGAVSDAATERQSHKRQGAGIRVQAAGTAPPVRAEFVLPVLVTLLDLTVVGWSIDVPAEYRDAAELLNPPHRAEWLKHVQGAGPGGQRPWRLSNFAPPAARLWVVTSREDGVPGEYIDPLGRGVADTNILLGAGALTDYGPLQPVRFVERFAFEPWGEALRARELLEDAGWMPRFNVGWVLLCDPALPAPASGRRVTTTSRGYRLYRIDAPLGEAYVEPLTARQAVRVEHLSPQGLRVRLDWGSNGAHAGTQGRTAAAGAGSAGTDASPRIGHSTFDIGHPAARLVVSRLAVRGWRATMDGKPAPLRVAHGCLLAVPLGEPGTHTIELWYQPPGLVAGLAVTCATVLIAVICLCAKSEARSKTSAMGMPNDE